MLSDSVFDCVSLYGVSVVFLIEDTNVSVKKGYRIIISPAANFTCSLRLQ